MNALEGAIKIGNDKLTHYDGPELLKRLAALVQYHQVTAADNAREIARLQEEVRVTRRDLSFAEQG